MVLAYGKFGLIADIALVVFGLLTMALYKLIPVVLTLPGIAGFLLSVGMSVDSNILIFERFKEEIKKRDFANALEVSFGRAWDSIRDANIATLVTAFILANPLDFDFLHTSGPVRGFAITLSLGILISLFTGIVVTRNLLRVFVKSAKVNKGEKTK
jgi:preprotein translocase subunit SecD